MGTVRFPPLNPQNLVAIAFTPDGSLPQDFFGRFELVHVAWRAMEQHTRRLLNEISEAMERAKDEDREELVRLHRAVERHVEGSGGDQAGLVNSLEMAEVRFEVDHPTLAQSIRQVLESLSSSGI